jgi:hypothetical protein
MKRPHIPATIALLALALLPVASAQTKPLKVYILAGQSNMQGHAAEGMLLGMAADPLTKPLHDKIVDTEQGKTRVFEDVRMAALSGKLEEPVTKSGPLALGYGGDLGGQPGASGKNAIKFGPELGFGVTMREHLQEPFLIIKTAWGGKSLRKDFLSPSGVPVVGGDATTGAHYQAMSDHVRAVLADPAKYVPGYDPKQMNDIIYTREEQEYMEMNQCNKGYHYHGSGKILGRIGEAFAKAMIAMNKQP